MSLAETLRQAMAKGAERSPALLAGDSVALNDKEGRGMTAAAVLVPIVDRPEPTMILTLRSGTVRRHAGQIAFPGGRIDFDDDSPTAAALREAEEEIGLSRQEVDVIGEADRYRTITGFEVTPVIGVLRPDLALVAHPGEVAAIFEVPLQHVFDHRHHILRTVEWQGSQRSYYEIDWHEHRIWGATAAMIVNLSRRLELAA